MQIDSPNKIYASVKNEIDGIQKKLNKGSSNPSLEKAISDARATFQKLKESSDENLSELESSAEWTNFTVAFYGETNAGKSTIIETLRILMNEKTKLDQQNKFDQEKEKLGLNEARIEAWESQKKEARELELKLDSIRSDHEKEISEYKAHEERSDNEVHSILGSLKRLPLWRRILLWVWRSPLQSELSEAKSSLEEARSKIFTLESKHQKNCENIETNLQRIFNEVNYINKAIKELSLYEDGEIIGDGRSDFTRESHRYEFDINNNKIVLLDVPGIEGKEELVKEPIMQAVRQAHAVFYVTRKADPPQKGDNENGQKGTLEKIKDHLGDQTEVYSIFNKGIKSPEQLRLPTLINKGEQESLAVLEEKMKEQLGDHYAGHLSLSAYPAFVSSTENFAPASRKLKDRNKFLSIGSDQSLLEKTGFKNLVEKLSYEMAENSKQKIKISNFNKANNAVIDLNMKIKKLNKETFSPLAENLEMEANSAIRQIESAKEALNERMESEITELLRKSKSRARKEIYERIDSNISNSTFKSELEPCIEKHSIEAQDKIPNTVKNNVEEFQEDVQDIATQFQDHVQERMEDILNINTPDIDLNFNIGSGINTAGLIGTAIGTAALLLTNPAGWIVITLGAIGLVFSFAKAIWSALSDDYKKSQQKKSANKNIDDTFDEWRDKFIKHLEKSNETLEDSLNSIKAEFRLPWKQAETIKNVLTLSSNDLSKLSKKIKREVEL